VDFTKQGRLLDKIVGKLGASFGQAIGTSIQGPSALMR
jgi:protease-4